jgi:peptidoglycan/LPS O-acetylase OafA/YrhL
VTPDWLVPVRGLSNGHAAVVLFFVLSGFVLTRSLANRLDRRGELKRFYIKRVFRIYPALIAATLLGIAYLLGMHFQLRVDGSSQWFEEFVRTDRIGPFWFVLAAGGMPYVLPQAWSIFIELVGSAMLPVLAWALLRRPTLFYALFAALAVLSFLPLKTPNTTHVYLVDFAIGAWLAAPPPRFATGLAKLGRRAAAMLFIVAMVALVGLRSVWFTEYHAPGLQLAEALLAALLIALVVYSRFDVPMLRARAAVLLGEWSYSLYLLHFSVMCILGRLIGAVLPPATDPGLFSLALLGGTLAVSLPLSWASFRFIEMPGVALGAKTVALIDRRSRGARVSTQ